LAFPCNQFGKQEPKSHEEILEFAKKFDNADEKFIFFAKSHVNGKETNEVFSYLKNAIPWQDGSKDVRWNFGKFLIDHEGTPWKRFGSKEAPSTMIEDVKMLITRKTGLPFPAEEVEVEGREGLGLEGKAEK